MKRKELLSILMLAVTLSAIFVFAEGFISPTAVSPTENSNHSGDLLLNITVDVSDTAANATNVTFVFLNSTTGALLYNTTIGPADPLINDTFNVTISTTSVLNDGNYNLTFNVTNSTGTTQLVNDSITNVSIDNEAPIIASTSFNNPGQGGNVSNDTVVFNFTITDGVTDVIEVVFNLSNGTNNDVLKAASRIDGTTEWNATFNMSIFDEISSTNITIHANDSVLNLNNSEVFNFTIDRTVPLVNIQNSSISSTDTTPTVTFNFTDSIFNQASCTLYLDGTSYGSNATTLNETATDITVNSALAVASYTAQVNCTDGSGNVNGSNEITVTVSSSSSTTTTTTSSSSGGGGATGSSGAVSTTSSTSHKEIWNSINADETANVEIDNENIAVTDISFDISETIWGPWIQVKSKEVEDLPSTVTELDELTNSYFFVDRSRTLTDEVMENIVVDFQVEKTWIDANNLKTDTVALYHFDEEASTWEMLDTLFSSEDSDYVYYTASVPSFSYFAVGQGAASTVAVEAEETDVEETTTVTETVGEETEMAEGVVAKEESSSKLPYIIGAVLIVLGLGYYLMNRDSAKPATKKKRRR